MSIILGIYSKDKEIDNHVVNPVINEFGRNRNVIINLAKKFVLVSYNNHTSKRNDLTFNLSNNISGIGGEVYNIQEKQKIIEKSGVKFQNRENTAEFILQSYLLNGEKFISDLDGNFSLAIYNEDKDELLLANDQFGIFPLFIYSDQNYFIFSNEYEPILKYPYLDIKLDKEALAEYFFLGAPLGGKTFFNAITNLQPGSIIMINGKSVTEKAYHIDNIPINYGKKIDDFASDFAFAFKHSVNMRAEHPHIFSCAITGGLDTRLIISALNKDQRERLKFISLLTEPLSEDEDRDILISKRIASLLGLNHWVEPMSEWSDIWTNDFDEGFFDKIRFRNKDYIISGHYGSELVKGEFIYLIPDKIKRRVEHKLKSPLSRLLYKVKKSNVSYGFETSNIITSEFKKYIPSVFENLDQELKKMDCENSDFQFAINFMTRSFFSNMYGGSYGSWLMTYRFPIEWSLPFLDKNILNILLSMPLEFLLRKDLKFYNQIYKDNFPALIKIPTSSHFGEIQGSCIDYFQFGKEPKNEKQPRYLTAYEKAITFPASKELNIFDFSGILKYKKQENHPDIRPFIEFEMWYEHVSNI